MFMDFVWLGVCIRRCPFNVYCWIFRFSLFVSCILSFLWKGVVHILCYSLFLVNIYFFLLISKKGLQKTLIMYLGFLDPSEEGEWFINGVEELVGEACVRYLKFGTLCVLCGLFGGSRIVIFLRMRSIWWISS